MFYKRRRHGRQVVVRQHDGRRGDRRGNAGAAGDRECRHPGAGLHEEAVRVPVIGTGELGDQIPAGRGPRDAEGAHHRLGPR